MTTACVLLGWVLPSPWLVALGALLVGTAAVAGFWARFALERVTFERTLSPPRLFAGESTTLTMRLENDKLLPLGWLRLVDQVPTGLAWGDEVLHPAARDGWRDLHRVTALRPYETVTWRLDLHCPQRGHYRFGPTVLRSGDIFGLSEVSQGRAERDRLVVYPAIRSLPRLGFPADDPLGDRRARRALLSDPVQSRGVRDHAPGDPRRSVHWKASARGRGLQVRLETPVSEETLLLLLDTATEHDTRLWIRPARQEMTIALAASIIHHADRDGRAVSLAATAIAPGGAPVRVPPLRGPAALPALLGALAAVGPYVHGTPARLTAREGRRAPWGATIAVVTWSVSEALEAALLRLHRAGRTVVLVTLDERYDGRPPYAVRRIDPDALAFARHGDEHARPAAAASELVEGQSAVAALELENAPAWHAPSQADDPRLPTPPGQA